ncbi:MAG: bifunctional oligoribonuclease/PAP phosphatase NrnA [Flavobacteriales bacterium]
MSSTPSASAPPAQVQALRELLSRSPRLAITTHYNPDGDAMGSALGAAHILRVMGHAVQVVLPNTPPTFLHWMPGAGDTLAFDTAKEACERAIKEADVLLCLDFNRPDRVSGLETALRAAPVKVLIDHHRDPDGFATIAFCDPDASSTCQMVFDIFSALGQADTISTDAATCLYTGLMTDTGSFRFSYTTPHTLRVAAALMERGAVPDRIHSAIMDDNTESRLRLLGHALSEKLVVLPELRTSVITLDRSELDRFHFKPGDTEGLVNFGLSIRGTRLAAFFVQRGDTVKISLRSKGDLPVNEFLAAHFEGGGHRNAAGGHSKQPLQAVVDRFMAELPAFLAAHPE